MKFIITSALAVAGLSLASCTSTPGSLGSNAVNGAVNGAVNSVVAPVNPVNALGGAVNNALTPTVATPAAPTSTLGSILGR